MPRALSRAEALSALGLPSSATRADAESAFRRLALKHHPDRLTSSPDGPGASDAFLALASARETLQADLTDGNDDGDHSWPRQGPAARADGAAQDEEDKPVTTGLFCSPLFDGLCGPHAFRRCEEGIRRGGFIGGCDCALCKNADLYAPLMANPPPVAPNLREAEEDEEVDWERYMREVSQGSWGCEHFESPRTRRRGRRRRRQSGRGGITPEGDFVVQRSRASTSMDAPAVFRGDLMDERESRTVTPDRQTPQVRRREAFGAHGGSGARGVGANGGGRRRGEPRGHPRSYPRSHPRVGPIRNRRASWLGPDYEAWHPGSDFERAAVNRGGDAWRGRGGGPSYRCRNGQTRTNSYERMGRDLGMSWF